MKTLESLLAVVVVAENFFRSLHVTSRFPSQERSPPQAVHCNYTFKQDIAEKTKDKMMQVNGYTMRRGVPRIIVREG